MKYAEWYTSPMYTATASEREGRGINGKRNKKRDERK
jgi:hypothetical protein